MKWTNKDQHCFVLGGEQTPEKLLDQLHNSPSLDFSQLLLPIKLIHEFISDQAISLAFAVHPTQNNVGLCSSISSSFSKFALDATLCIYPLVRMCSLSSLLVFPLRHTQYSLFLCSHTHVHSSLFDLFVAALFCRSQNVQPSLSIGCPSHGLHHSDGCFIPTTIISGLKDYAPTASFSSSDSLFTQHR